MRKDRELTPEELKTLRDLAGPGPRIDKWESDPNKATSMPRHFDIPATHQLRTATPSDEELVNIIRTGIYKLFAPGQLAFNPVREFEAYQELFNRGLVLMTTEQGSNVVKIEITPEGARRLGKELVE